MESNGAAWNVWADSLYSVTLGLAIAAALGSLLFGWRGWRVGRKRGETHYRRARVAAAFALGLVVTSFVVHLGFGHRPGTEEALELFDFMREHPAFLGVAAGALVLARLFRP